MSGYYQNLFSSDQSAQQRSVTLPVLGLRVPLPTAERAIYYGGIAGLVAAELIEWPVALVVLAGHEILMRSRNPLVREVGKAAESA
jgi:hypothetical protein